MATFGYPFRDKAVSWYPFSAAEIEICQAVVVNSVFLFVLPSTKDLPIPLFKNDSCVWHETKKMAWDSESGTSL